MISIDGRSHFFQSAIIYVSLCKTSNALSVQHLSVSQLVGVSVFLEPVSLHVEMKVPVDYVYYRADFYNNGSPFTPFKNYIQQIYLLRKPPDLLQHSIADFFGGTG